MRLALVLAFASAACDGGESCDGLSWTFRVTSDASFDRLGFFYFGMRDPGAAIVSPALIDSGQPAPSAATIYHHTRESTWVDVPASSSSYVLNDWGFHGPQAVAVLALREQVPIGYAESTSLEYHTTDCGDSHTEASLAIAAVDTIELWTLPPSLVADSDDLCVRLVAGAQTEYMVSEWDLDCDGQADDVPSSDCRPRAYCNPADPSPAAIAACACM